MTATVSAISTRKQRDLIARAVELKALIDGAKDALDEILAQFKAEGPGDYIGRDGRQIQVRFAERQSLDTKIVKGFLTPAQIIEATKTTQTVTATVR